MRKYKTKRSSARMVARLVAPLLIFAGLVVMGYSLLIGDPFAVAALFGPDAPKNSTMSLTVPEMKHVDEVPVYDANVYIAGHRLGFPGTKSYLVFWDLNRLESGDEVILTDANGTKYTYEVFKKFIVDPSELSVTQPVAGKSIVTLQTCTLPDYKQRLIVQGELKSVS
jgi:sortase A